MSPDIQMWSSPDAAPLALHLLGAPKIRHRGQEIALPRSQTRALLYRLGATLEPVSRDELMLLFWPELDDGTARQNLRRLLSFVRRDLPEPDVLSATSDMVRLEPQLVWSDTHIVTHLQHTDDAADLRAAVDLYNGPFLYGFYLRNNAEFDLWQSAIMERLRTQCLEALAKLIDSYVDRADLPQAVRYARRYLEIDNLGETAHRKLILLYTQMGKRDLALRQYEECVLVLERELGVEPLPETRAAYELAMQDGVVRPVAKPVHTPVYHLLPTLEIPLVGRESVLRQLAKAYARLRQGGLIVVSGEPGIGKSRIVQAFTAQEDALVLTGHCHAGSKSLPYYPVAEIFRQAITHPHLGRGDSEVWLLELEQLLPDLRIRFPDLAERSDVDPAHSQRRRFEAWVQLLLGLATYQPLILYFDDMHSADDATIAWLQYASERLRSSRVCIMASVSETYPAALATLIVAMERQGMVAQIKLEGVTADDVLVALHAVKNPEPHDEITARRIHRAAGGNPFYMLELLRELMEGNLLSTLPSQLPVPNSLQQTFEWRIRRLSPTARQILEAAAVLDPELDYDLVHATTGRDEMEVSDGLEELVNLHLLSYAEGRLHFHHSIIQVAVYSALRVWRRRLLHQRAADALIRLGVKRGIHLSAIVAFHCAAAGNNSGALQHYYEACLRAQRYSSARVAVQYATDAITLIGPSTPAQTVASLYEALGDSLGLLGQLDAALTAFRNALILDESAGSLQSANLMVKSAALLTLQAKYAEATAMLLSASKQLDAHPQPHDTAWWQTWIDLRLQGARIYMFQAHVVSLARAVEDLSPRISEHGTPRHRRMYCELVQWSQILQGILGANEVAIAERHRALAAAIAYGCPHDIVAARQEYGDALFWGRHLVEARAVLSVAYEEARAIDQAVIQLECASRLLILYRLEGQAELAEALCPGVLTQARAIGIPLWEGVAKAQEAWLLLRRGEQARAHTSASQALSAWENQRFPMRWLALWIVLIVQLGAGQIEGAVQSAWYMLDATEQLLSPDVGIVLLCALDSWTTNAAQAAADMLHKAVELGIHYHYS